MVNLYVFRKLLIINTEGDDPIGYFIDYFLFLVLHDDAFDTKSVRHINSIFSAKMLPGKKSFILKWKRKVLNLPVFREPARGADGFKILPTESLRANIWIRYFKRLGRKAGL